METIIINASDDEALKTAAHALREGQLVAFPTETVYGLGANALNPEAVKKIYEAKGRPSDNPLIVHIAKISQLNELVSDIPDHAKVLMKAFWPGPLTLVFKKSDLVPSIITGGLDTVAVRMPNNPIALKLIEESGVPIAAPSANLSGRPSPTCADHVAQDLSGRIKYIIDGGSCTVGVESTVLDIISPIPVILRPGGTTREMLEKVVGKVEVDPVLEVQGNVKPRAPGMKYRHYSPKAEMILVNGEPEKVVERINTLTAQRQKEGLLVGVLASQENADRYKANVVISAGSIKHLEHVAAELFGALRKFDDTKVDIIYSETFCEQGIGQAVMNRLKKASSGKILEVKG